MQVSEVLPRAERTWWTRLLTLRQRRDWAWSLGAAALGLGTFVVWLAYLDAPLDVDVGVYATVAYWWARGDVLYQHITTDRPQGIFVVFRAIEAFGLGSLRGIHLAAAIYATLTTLALLVVASRAWGRAIGMGAAALFSLVMATPYLQGPTANAELFMLLPSLISLDLLLRSETRPPSDRLGLVYLFVSGLLGAVALLVKPPGFAVVVLAVLWITRRWQEEGTSWHAWLRAEAALVGGFLAGILPAVAHGLFIAPDRYLYAVFLYRFSVLSIAATPLSAQLYAFLVILFYIIIHFPVLLLTPLGLFAIRRDARRRDLLWLWLITSLGGASLGGNWYPHYFQQLLPPLSVAAVLALRSLMRPLKTSRTVLQWCWSALRVAAVLSLVYLLLSLVRVLFPSSDQSRLVIDHTFPPMATREVASYLRKHTAPEDTIYVAYGQGDIYFRSRRRPAARWLHANEIRRIPGAFDEQVARLADPASAPRYIVEAQDFARWGLDADGRLRALVARDYVLETTIEGIPLYRRAAPPGTAVPLRARAHPHSTAREQ